MKERKPVTIIVIGAGHRCQTYLEFALRYPEKLQVVGVVEPHPLRRQTTERLHGLKKKQTFDSLEEFYATTDRLADAVLVSTPDDMHYVPTMFALERGYHVLLEKPIAQSIDECRAIEAKAAEKGLIVGVCHILRFHPCYVRVKEIIDSGLIGSIQTVNHVEAVGIDRMTHAFVRGIWGQAESSNPMILSKCCHDFDLLVWLTGQKCKRLNSFGSLRWFRPESAPLNSSRRCTDCQVEQGCPYSAVDLYLHRRKWLRHFDIQHSEIASDRVIKQALRTGPYGVCVYRSGNDVVDHQIVSMELELGVTVNFSMDAFTLNSQRSTHIMGTVGEIMATETTISFTDFVTRSTQTHDFSHLCGEGTYHAGADLALVANFVDAITGRAPIRTAIKDAIQSHEIAFAAERSRLGRTIEEL